MPIPTNIRPAGRSILGASRAIGTVAGAAGAAGESGAYTWVRIIPQACVSGTRYDAGEIEFRDASGTVNAAATAALAYGGTPFDNPTRAFDKNESSLFRWGSCIGGFLEVRFEEVFIPAEVRHLISDDTNRVCTSANFYWSSNGVDWTTIATGVSIDTQDAESWGDWSPIV